MIVFNPKDKSRRTHEDNQLEDGEKTICVVESVQNLGIYDGDGKAGLPRTLMTRVQRVQNSAARLVTQS